MLGLQEMFYQLPCNGTQPTTRCSRDQPLRVLLLLLSKPLTLRLLLLIRRRLLWLALWCCGAWLPAAADEFRPAYLQLTQIDASTYDVRALGAAAVLDRAAFLLAEGVAGELILDTLRRHGVAQALVSLGGDVVALGELVAKKLQDEQAAATAH